MNPLIKRIYHPYWKWEETMHNMWGRVKDRNQYLKKAIEFTGDAKLYGDNMIKVIEEWKYSCEHNLSHCGQNKQAWIGHAACAFAFGCPEDIVREAWGHLSDKQQIDANEMADRAIEQWERNHLEGLCQKEN